MLFPEMIHMETDITFFSKNKKITSSKLISIFCYITLKDTTGAVGI